MTLSPQQIETALADPMIERACRTILAAGQLCAALEADRRLLAVLARPEHRDAHAAADALRAAVEGVGE